MLVCFFPQTLVITHRLLPCSPCFEMFEYCESYGRLRGRTDRTRIKDLLIGTELILREKGVKYAEFAP